MFLFLMAMLSDRIYRPPPCTIFDMFGNIDLIIVLICPTRPLVTSNIHPTPVIRSRSLGIPRTLDFHIPEIIGFLIQNPGLLKYLCILKSIYELIIVASFLPMLTSIRLRSVPIKFQPCDIDYRILGPAASRLAQCMSEATV